ncbi:D-aminoacylase [Aquisphaera giovannonii]|uniref:D-aminoacylase n=1 Tax=Aquisphaera giovannonii TaxID=406548 RepID=A0A5B9W2K6_9BACT|nr:amidohydrolase family protein [Aquisphaera giovannonii]QEH34447.1 D-aminoacylase [Aquisphaera giovannonii]
MACSVMTAPARTATLLALLASWTAATTAVASEPTPIRADYVLRGGTLIDGTGAPARRGDVAVRGDRIVALGTFPVAAGTKVVDVSSLVVAPGFIDLHTHSDDGITAKETRLNLNFLTQGVTTVVTGNCGSGPIDVAKYLAAVDARGAGTNVAHLIPQGSLRYAVMQTADRPSNRGELDRMRHLAARGMDAGAWGMASGLIYVPSRYARTAELVDVARVVGAAGGLYASHIRSEEEGLFDAVDEAILIGKQAGLPVHISHLKANGRANWGRAADLVARVEAARKAGQKVTADQYPYIASSTKLGAMVVPHWAIRGSGDDFAAMAADPSRGPLLRAEIQKELDRRDGGAAVRIARYQPRPAWNGKDLVQIARAEGVTPLDVVMEIQRHGGAQAIGFGMSEEDVREIMRHDFVATASDASTHVPGKGDRPHPRAYGTFPRKIRYALDDRMMSLEQAVRSCSGLPAEILGLPERGTLRVGNYADIVAFDPATFRDAATFDDPTVYAPGVRFLLVNGVALIADGRPTVKPLSSAKLPGRALRRQSDGPADLILVAGRIWTGDDANPRAEAIALRAGLVAAIGTRAEVDRFRGPKTVVVENPSAFAMPGLVDAHGHVESLGRTLEEVDLRDVRSPEEVARRVKARASVATGNGWIGGRNWDQSLWPGGAFPAAAALDAAVPVRPVWLRRVDGHAGWANSEAMRRAGVGKDTKDPAGGKVHRDAEGRPTGVFIDEGMSLIDKVVPPASEADIRRRILAAQRLILAAGLTGVHDAGISTTEEKVYRELDRSGELVLRVYAMASAPDRGILEKLAHRPITPTPGSRFEMRGVKLFVDGAMGSRGALLFEPYADDPKNRGLMLLDPKSIEQVATLALANGWQVATHAIGDRGNALVLDAYAAARKAVPQAKDPRPRIEHAQVVRRGDVKRFAALGVIASMQPSHASDDLRWADARLGTERSKGAYAWRWFLDERVPLAFGSDFPVEVVNPFWGIYAAITRRDAEGRPEGGWHPEQTLSLEETLRAFTAGAAFAGFAEGRAGILRPGMQADLTVVDRDLFRVSPEELLASKVVMTIVGGKVAFGGGPGGK